MNEEEKKVVEHLKKTSKDRTIIPLDDEILIAVNLIEKLQKENELAKKQVEYDKTHIFTPQTIKLHLNSKNRRQDRRIKSTIQNSIRRK